MLPPVYSTTVPPDAAVRQPPGPRNHSKGHAVFHASGRFSHSALTKIWPQPSGNTVKRHKRSVADGLQYVGAHRMVGSFDSAKQAAVADAGKKLQTEPLKKL